MSECKCSMSISVLGDGCRYCQPQEYIDSLERVHKENDELLETCEDLETQLAETREEAKRERKRMFLLWYAIGFCLDNKRIAEVREVFKKQLKEKGENE